MEKGVGGGEGGGREGTAFGAIVGTYWFEVGIAWWRPLLDGDFRVGSRILCLVADMLEGLSPTDKATRYFHTTNIANGNPSWFFNPRFPFIYRLLRKSNSMY